MHLRIMMQAQGNQRSSPPNPNSSAPRSAAMASVPPVCSLPSSARGCATQIVSAEAPAESPQSQLPGMPACLISSTAKPQCLHVATDKHHVGVAPWPRRCHRAYADLGDEFDGNPGAGFTFSGHKSIAPDLQSNRCHDVAGGKSVPLLDGVPQFCNTLRRLCAPGIDRPRRAWRLGPFLI